MSILLDIILIAIFVVYIILATQKGFVRTVLELVATIAAVFLAFQFSPIIAQSVYDGFVEEKIVSTIEENAGENIDTLTVGEEINAVIDSIPDFAISFASSVGVEVSDIKEQASSIKIDTDNISQSLADEIAEPIVTGALTVIIFIILYIVLSVALKIAAKYISKLFNIPLVKSLNQSLGGVAGAIKGAISLVVICTALRFIFGDSESEMSTVVDESFVVGLLEKINPFIDSFKEYIAK